MIKPGLSEYFMLASDAYELTNKNGLFNTNFKLPKGYTEVAIDNTHLADGFSAVALRDKNGNVIIVNEGTVFGSGIYDKGSQNADQDIFNGQTPQALLDAAGFARTVEQQLGGNTPIFVDGHSLGGADAEAEARSLVLLSPSDFAGGTTFAAPGLPGNSSLGPSQVLAGGASQLTDYIDYGDPVANYASDKNSPLESIASKDQYHYGDVKYIGSPSSANGLKNMISDNMNAFNSQLNIWRESQGNNARAMSEAYEISALVDFVSAALHFHPMANYASDLGLSNTYTPIAPPLSDFLDVFDIALGAAEIRNNADAVINSDGSITTSNLNLSYNAASDQVVVDQTQNITESWGVMDGGGVTTFNLNPANGLISSAIYTSSDNAVFTATLNPLSQHIQALSVNESDGTSCQVTYDLNGNQPWSAFVQFYSGSNETGTLISNSYDWTAGGSQVNQLSGDPEGGSDVATNYSGENGAGNITSTVYAIAGSGQLTVDPGVASGQGYSASSPIVDIALSDPASGLALGTLAFNASTDADSVTLTDGLVVPLSGITDNVLSDPDQTAGAAMAARTADTQSSEDTPAGALLAYLSDLNDSTSLAGLDALNFAYLNPAATPYAVQPTQVTPIDNDTAADVYYVADGAAGAVFAGQVQATIVVNGQDQQVTAYNILNADNANLAQDSISDMQELESYGAGTTLVGNDIRIVNELSDAILLNANDNFHVTTSTLLINAS